MDVDILVFIGFDEESDKALRNAFRAAEILRELYGINAYVVPINTWIHDPLRQSIAAIPQVVVRGRVLARSRAPAPQEIVEGVVRLLNAHPVPEPMVPAAVFEDPGQSDAVAVENA